MSVHEMNYSEKYADGKYEYRHVTIPKDLVSFYFYLWLFCKNTKLCIYVYLKFSLNDRVMLLVIVTF